MIIDVCREGIMKKGLLELIHDLPFNITMAEIGSWQGESAEMFLKSGKIIKFFSIDPYGNDERRMEAEDIFKWRVSGFNVVKIRSTSNEGMSQCDILDFVYIDGNHSYEWVKADIKNSLDKIRKGGIIGGHDYGEKYIHTVVKAVDELLGKPDKIYDDTSWIKRL